MNVKTLILQFCKERKGTIAAYLILLLVGTLLSLVGITKVTAWLYKAVGDNDKDKSFKLLIALFSLTVAFTANNWGIDYIENRLMPSFHRFVRTKVNHEIIDTNELSLMPGTSALQFRAYVTSTTQAATNVFNALIKQYIPNITMIVILIGFLFYLNPIYGLIFLFVIATIMAVFFGNKKIVTGNSKHVESKVRAADNFTFDILQHIKTVAASGQTQNEKEAIAKIIQEATNAQIEQSQKFDNLSYALNAILLVGVFATMAIAVNQLGQEGEVGEKTVHTVLTALSLMAKLQAKTTSFSNTNLSIVQSFGQAEANYLQEVDQFQKPEPGTESVCPSLQQPWCEVEVRFENVSFRYKKSQRYTIRNFNWTVGPRGIYCLRAPSGSGKSTLAMLLVRNVPVTSGNIFVNNKKLESIQLQDLREKIFLLDNESLMQKTIQDILLYGAPNQDEKTMQKMQQLWTDEIKDMFGEFKLDTNVGPDGKKLSKGMKAILKFYSAVLNDKPFIIADEPSDGLSPEYKAKVLNAIKEMALTKTVLLITHDAETAKIAHHVKEVTSLA